MENDKTIGIVKLIASFFNGGIGITKATESNVIKDDKSNIIKEKNDLSIPKSSDEILEIDNERDNYMNSENTYGSVIYFV